MTKPFITHDGKFRRIGKCHPEKCKGVCCKFNFLNISVPDEGGKLAYRLYKGSRPIRAEGGKITIATQDICPYLKDGKCSIHELARPVPCMKFPEYPNDFFKATKAMGCTYDFVEIKKRH